jgi:KUP system potassium uptake protein
MEYNQVLQEQVLILMVVAKDVPAVGEAQRIKVTPLGQGLSWVEVSFGFMETPYVPDALQQSSQFGLDVDPEKTVYYVGRQIPVPTREKGGMALWRKELFALLARNAALVSAFYRLPTERVMELGIEIPI